MPFRVNNCCCCSLKTGIFCYAVLCAFGAASMLIRSAFSPTETVVMISDDDSDDYYTNHKTTYVVQNINTAEYTITFFRAMLLLYGVIKENAKIILAYLAIEGVVMTVATILIVILSFFMPVLALFLIAVAIECFCLIFVYSYYRELVEKRTTNVNAEQTASDKV